MTYRAWILTTIVAIALPATSLADGWVPPFRVQAGAKAWFNVYRLDANMVAPLQPWYLYFPYEKHFQTPAPVGNPYPYWPGVPPQQAQAPQGQQPTEQPAQPPANIPTTLPENRPLIPGVNVEGGNSPTGYHQSGYRGYMAPTYPQQPYPVPSYQAPSYWYNR